MKGAAPQSISSLKPFDHAFATVDGLRFHYVTAGPRDGETVILLAGYPQSWYAWRYVMSGLAHNYRVIAIDLPGQGDTDKPLYGYDTQTVAARIGRLIEHLGIGHCHLVAHDIGAWVALPFAFLFPRQVTRLALLDAGIPGVTLPEMLPTVPDKAWRTWHFAFHAVPDLPEALIAGREDIYVEWFLKRKVANPFAFSRADIEEYLRIFRLPGALRAGLSYYREAGLSAEQNRQFGKAGRLTLPVLGISADQGSIPDMAGPLRCFANDVIGAEIPGCGHFIPEEQPEALMTILREFLSTREAD